MSTLLTDATAVVTNGPSATTKANAIAAAGPIQDYIGNTKQIVLKLNEVKTLVNLVINDTDSGTDSTNLALLQGITGALV